MLALGRSGSTKAPAAPVGGPVPADNPPEEAAGQPVG